ncbi:MAG: hypothetical protein AABX23_02460 [Nanoarchaeota archaeon]
MNRKLIISIVVIFILIAGYFLFFYRSDFQVCLNQVCTDDIRLMCNSITGERWEGPSSCSCSIDSAVLEKRGWEGCYNPLNE